MSKEPFALSTISPSSLEEESDYDTICATVMESARGRWFLEEYARRNRNADTRLVLAAIERIDRLIRSDRSPQADRGFRSDLLEMARTIAQTRAEIAGESEAGARDSAAARHTKKPQPRLEIFATAERLHDVAWTMRECGLDPRICEEIETLASSILAASSLQDPADQRAQKLKEVLQYLERRISSMLDAGAQALGVAPHDAGERRNSESGESPADAGAELRSFSIPAIAAAAPTMDPSAELQPDPIVMEPPAGAMAMHASIPVVTNEAPSLSDAEPRGGPTANLIPAVELAIVEPTRSLETIPTMTGATVVFDWTRGSAAMTVDPLEVEPLVSATGVPSADQCCEAVSPQLCLLIATPIPSQAEQSSATFDSPATIADEDQTESSAEPPVEPAAAWPPRRLHLLHATDDDLLAQSTLDIWGGQPLPAAPSDTSTEPSLDPIWDIERELFAPEPIEFPSDEIVSRRFRATPSAVSPPRPGSPVNATVATPVEQIAHASMTAQTPAAAASAALPRPMVRPIPRAAPTDPLAALKAMTPEERIALFT